MSHIPSSIKLTFCMLLLLTASACRKKVFVPASETTAVGADKYVEWTKIPSSYSNLDNFCLNGTDLYFTAKESGNEIVKFSVPDAFHNLPGYPYSNSVFKDLKMYDNKLFMGGKLYTSINSNPYMVGSIHPVLYSFSGYLPKSNGLVYGMEVLNGKLYFCGNFTITSATGSVKKYIGAINGTSVDNSMVTLYGEPNGLHIGGSSQIYVYGSRVANAQNYSGIAYTSGSGMPWTSLTYGGNQKYKNVKSMVLMNGKFFFSYIQMGEQELKVGMVANNSYQSLPEINLTKDATVNFKVLDGKVYLFGDGISLHGKATNVLFRKDDGTWAYNNIISATVNDLVIYENKLYAATNDGLYRE